MHLFLSFPGLFAFHSIFWFPLVCDSESLIRKMCAAEQVRRIPTKGARSMKQWNLPCKSLQHVRKRSSNKNSSNNKQQRTPPPLLYWSNRTTQQTMLRSKMHKAHQAMGTLEHRKQQLQGWRNMTMENLGQTGSQTDWAWERRRTKPKM